MTKYIPLINGGMSIVDDQDYEQLSRFIWRAVSPRRTTIQYARRIGGKNITMHRMIMQPPAGMVVDHINGNGLDNRRANLRVCTYAENLHNSKLRRNNKTGFRGVYLYKGRFAAEIICNKKKYRLGMFATAEEAARAYDLKALEHFKNFARLNFPNPEKTSRKPKGKTADILSSSRE